MPSGDESRYAIQDLADLADVSRRTVRYYVQEGLIPAPLGVGRGRHYAQAHLNRLLQVKELQAAGRTLDEIRATLVVGAAARPVKRAAASLPDRSIWRRLQIAPGIEVHVAHHVTLPGPNRLRELAAWCRLHFTSSSSE
jgi:DNA-binding transcriptional MerR regulator